VLDHDDLHVRIAEGFAPTIPAGASFPHRFRPRKPCWSENSAKRASCRSKSAFWSRRKLWRITPHRRPVCWRSVDNHRARGQLLGGHGQLASLPHAPRRLVGKPLLSEPNAQLHVTHTAVYGTYGHAAVDPFPVNSWEELRKPEPWPETSRLPLNAGTGL
jgi:hypothetical protein